MTNTKPARPRRGPASSPEAPTANKAAQKPTCTILTYCADPALLYGTLLTFKTLRVGFPSARVMVFDNGSHPEVRPQIERAAKDAGCEYREMPRQHYVDYYRWLLLQQEVIESLVILDPDLVFWAPVEGWDFGDALMAGRLMPSLHALKLFGRQDVETVPRLHTSHLWVPDVMKMRAAINELQLSEFDPFAQRTSAIGGKFYFWDTLAALYNSIPEKTRAFTDHELDQYDHLFYGSHFPVAKHGTTGTFMAAHEDAAMGNLEALRGIWRAQQRFFETPNDSWSDPNQLAVVREVMAGVTARFQEIRTQERTNQ